MDALLPALEDARRRRVGVWSLDLDISSDSAADYIDERRAVSGTVEDAFSTDKITVLKMKGLSVAIFARDMRFFRKDGISPVEFYRGRRIRVFGHIKEYKGRPEIIVSHPSQIELVD